MVRKLKALLAPSFWKVPKKEQHWVISPSPGPHKKFECIPLAILLRNVLKIVDTANEAKKVIKMGEVLVDGKVKKDHRYPAGLFDVVSIPKLNKHYRIVPFKNGLKPVEISEEEANKKICKVVKKTTVKEGRNIIFNNSVKTNDSLLLELPSLKVLDIIKFETGNIAISKRGFLGKIENYSEKTKLVILKSEKESYSTSIEYIYVVGKEKPLITCM